MSLSELNTLHYDVRELLCVVSHNVGSLIPTQCPGSEAALLAECHVTIVVFSPSVDTGFDTHDIPYDVLWLDIEHTNGKRFGTVQSVVKCVCSLVPRPSYCGSGNETMEYVSDVSVSWLIVLYCPDTSLGTQPSFQTQLA